ncbi:MAG TPA: amidohydrolase, partial [Lachnospiraceae bacterium]|nr:amidohydrolase [Lachnospiraceae bacterium]
VKEAIDSFTKGGAYASFEEEKKGQIKEGMIADFVVLGQDPFKVDPYELGEIPVLKTYVDGNLVYENQTF